MEPDALRAEFQAEGLAMTDLNSSRARSVVAKGNVAAAPALGNISGRKGREALVSCKLVQADGKYLPGQVAEPVRPKGMVVEAKERPTVYLPAQRVNLSEAQAWVVNPGTEKAIPGFFSALGADGECRRFKVVDASQSLAARQGFSDQRGVITVVFHTAIPAQERSTARSLSAVDFGPSYHVPVDQYKDYVVGDVLAAINILYGEE